MYYGNYVPYDAEIEAPNPYGLPDDPIIEAVEIINENYHNIGIIVENDEKYFNEVVNQMYHTHKNTLLFPAQINCSKSMDFPKLRHNKKNVARHKSDPTNNKEKKKHYFSKHLNKGKKNKDNTISNINPTNREDVN